MLWSQTASRLQRHFGLSCVLLATVVAGCTTDDHTSDIPSQSLRPPAAEYQAAADSARLIARQYMATRYLPGLSVAVGREGEVVWAEGFGWADLSSEALATPETLYPVGSISKPLTATAAGLLYERGMLDFDAIVQQYVPEFPEKRWPVTTRELMGHIASVHNYGAAQMLRREHCDNARAGVAEIAGDTLFFEPRTQFRYSNHGFGLVGAVVEAAAGEPYLDFMKREVFAAMGLERTMPDLGDQTAAARATFYDMRGFHTLRRSHEIDMSCAMSAGGFLSTPSELVRFGYAMLDAEILQRETVDMFWTRQRLTSGAPTNYGMGWQISTTRLGDDEASTIMIGHGGAVPGGRAALMIFPEQRMVVATMTNTSASVNALAGRLAGIFRDAS